jgi:hypothetical protein
MVVPRRGHRTRRIGKWTGASIQNHTVSAAFADGACMDSGPNARAPPSPSRDALRKTLNILYARNVSVAPGSTPNIPSLFTSVPGSAPISHTSSYLTTLAKHVPSPQTFTGRIAGSWTLSPMRTSGRDTNTARLFTFTHRMAPQIRRRTPNPLPALCNRRRCSHWGWSVERRSLQRPQRPLPACTCGPDLPSKCACTSRRQCIRKRESIRPGHDGRILRITGE